jgi:hypothetical protein
MGCGHWSLLWRLVVDHPKSVFSVETAKDGAAVLTWSHRRPLERREKMFACRAAPGRSGRSRSLLWFDYMCVRLGM